MRVLMDFDGSTIRARMIFAVIEEGMVTSDEPGVYIEGQVRYKN